MKLITDTVGTLHRGAEFACDTPGLQRMFVHAALGCVLDVIEGSKVTRIIWA